MVLDGSGKPSFAADVAIANGRIAAIGNIPPQAATEIDASGLCVAPGFIDIHSHSDYTLLVDPRAQSAIHQGVTLEAIGNCGFGCFPLRNTRLAKRAIYGISDDLDLTWHSAVEYFERLTQARPAVNVLSLVPNGQLRLSAMGMQPRAATPDEMRSMVRELEEAMDAGAYGFSSGLEYAQEVGASRENLETLCRVVARRGGLYATHTRYRDAGSVGAVQEAIETAQATGVQLQISHLLPRSGRADCEQCVELVDGAVRSGQNIAFDMHTRLFGLTFLNAMLPPSLNEDDPRKLRDLLMQQSVRDRIHAHKSILTASGNWKRLVLLDNTVYPEYARLSFEEIGALRQQAPAEAAIDLLAGSLESSRPPMVIAKIYAAEDQELAFSHDRCVPGSDATTLALTGPLAQSEFHGAYGWAAWFYRFSVHERGYFTPQEAVRRLSSMPAEILGLPDRGSIKVGHHADIAIFDSANFGETTTTFEPNSLAKGMHHVIVNGRVTLKDGQLTGDRSGQVVRRN